jgi:renalase
MNDHSANVSTVAIVGAGMAGLSCATRLQALGFHVQVFEKSCGPSGRMSTRHVDGWSVDHGAQYFTAREPIFSEELSSWINAGVVAAWNPRLKIFENNQWQDSPSKENRFVGTPAMNSVGKYLAKNLSIQFNQTINKITHQSGKWLLHSLEAENLEQQFDWLILALPAPQTFELAKSVHTPIKESITQIEMLGCWTVMARFAEAPNLPFDAAFINNEVIRWISRNNSKPGRAGQESWTIHASAQWSEQWIELDKEDAGKRILQCAKKFGLNCENAEISIHRWRYASGAVNPSIGFSLNEVTKLGLCGDWLNGGRVEGAWLSGYKLASRIKRI